MPAAPSELRVPALRIAQGPNRTLYVFGVDGKELPRFTTISRVRRDDESKVQGYQRPEVLSHISEIRRYIESTDPLIPNALVIAFDDRVKFVPLASDQGVDYSTPGTLIIPIDDELEDADKPGWIVDGQQRTAAIRDARIDAFPVSVVSFIAAGTAEQRAQFILVNATKPLPKSLIYELLPSTDSALPRSLAKKRLPATVLEKLNFDPDSPLVGMIQTPTTPEGVIKDNSMLRALENSITDGALYRFRDPETGKGDIDRMSDVLMPYWTAVQMVFPGAWGLPPRKSRLMHGAGIISMSFMMDTIAEPILDDHVPTVEDYIRGLKVIESVCHWIDGEWIFGEGLSRRWNDVQNIPRDIQLLTSYLLFEYRRRQLHPQH